MAKKLIQRTLQRLLGFDRYLQLFAWFIIRTIKWNPREGDINHLLHLLAPGDHVLDIGANIGIMTVLLAKRCPEGHVYAFEPVADNMKALRKTVEAYGLANVSLYEVALGAEKGKVEMRMPILQGVKMQGLSHVLHQDIDGYEGEYQVYQVPEIPLDEIPVLREREIRAIKLDVENYEQYVLRGATRLIRRCKPLIYVELWDNDNRKACMDLLTEMGYQPKVLVKKQLIPYQQGVHSHQNFFFIWPK